MSWLHKRHEAARYETRGGMALSRVPKSRVPRQKRSLFGFGLLFNKKGGSK